MNIKFNIEKSQRKALAQKIGELTGSEVKYLGVPSCGYQIGGYTLDKDSILHSDDFSDEFRSALEKAGYTVKDGLRRTPTALHRRTQPPTARPSTVSRRLTTKTSGSTTTHFLTKTTQPPASLNGSA